MPTKRRTVGSVLRGHRESRGLNLRDAGDLTGVDYSYLGRIETGASIPSITILVSIADGYDLLVLDILKEAGVR